MVALLNRDVYRGDTKTLVIALFSNRYRQTPFDLTGATLLGQVRDSPGSTVLATLVTTLEPADVNGVVNKVRVELSATDSAALLPGEHRWEVQATMPGAPARKYTLIGGVFTTIDDIARP